MNVCVWGTDGDSVDATVALVTRGLKTIRAAGWSPSLSGLEAVVIPYEPGDDTRQLALWMRSYPETVVVIRSSVPPPPELSSLSICYPVPDTYGSAARRLRESGLSLSDAAAAAATAATGWDPPHSPSNTALAVSYLTALRNGELERALTIADKFGPADLTALRALVLRAVPYLLPAVLESDDPVGVGYILAAQLVAD